MASKTEPKKGYVRTQTVVLAVFLAFAAGFFSGIVLTIFKSGGAPPAGVDDQTAAAMEESRQRKEQIERLREMTREDPRDAEAWTRLGHAYFDENSPAKAITAYGRALEIGPANADVWTDLGVMYRRDGQPEEAVRAFDRSLSIDPGHEIALFNKGVVLIHDLDEVETGLETWQALLEINPMARAPNGQPVEDLVRHFKEHVKDQGAKDKGQPHR